MEAASSLDASVLVKRYLPETGSAWVESLCADEANNAIAIARFGLVETAAAFAAKRRGQFITDGEYESALADLLRDAGERNRLVAVRSAPGGREPWDGIHRNDGDPVVEHVFHRFRIHNPEMIELI